MLDQLQENASELWGEQIKQLEDQGQPYGSVVACDFYNAGALISLPDEDIIKVITKELLPR
jgi:hypothetical protein